MKPTTLPTPYELAHIAATIKSSGTIMSSTALVNGALDLWKAAELAINTEQTKINFPLTEELKETVFIISKNKAPEAIAWLANNARHDRDQLKSPIKLFSEWKRFEISEGISTRRKIRFKATPKRMLEFLLFREDERRTQDTQLHARKRNTVK